MGCGDIAPLIFKPDTEMEWSGQLHTSSTLPPRTSRDEAWWDTASAWGLRSTEISARISTRVSCSSSLQSRL